MKRFVFFTLLAVLTLGVQASWYWPFGSEDGGEPDKPRISTLMEPASMLIDEASDLAAEGRVDESVEKYRAALAELDRIERENPERSKTSEFATLRNKRAYVNAAIDSMLLGQVKSNARVVAVSDTTELERRLAKERGEKPKSKPEVEQRKEADSAVRLEASTLPASRPARPPTKREQAMDDIERGDYASAELLIGEMLAAKPNGAMALNLKAALEMKRGNLAAAEAALDRAVMSNPRNYSAYYNTAVLLLRKGEGNKSSAKRYYETGRAMGGPENPELEALLK
ncbi:MAG: tetratricopeptide repeat protein [Kiritimatiellae bacterium]|nr:tetratricopeptide repeat protein [Kiritimatiellia bacterium]